ncbi:MAG: hypothetical protein FJ207_00755 [Gemmatimonadetes bacterium]|nr:hypothetical protein [Gemmatimonadota bacterium]
MRYAASATVLMVVLTLGLWPILAPQDRPYVALAALVALLVQVPAFAILIRYRGQVNGFLSAMIGGMALRALAVLGVAAFLILSGSQSIAATLLALVSFLFVLLLLESVHFKSRPKGVA